MTIILMGEPVTKKNSRQIVHAGGKTVIIPSKAYLAYCEKCLWQIKARDRVRICEPVEICYSYYLKRRGKVDLDNLVAATNDILQAGDVLADDDWIRRIVAEKATGHSDPRVEIEISILPRL